MDVLLFRCKRPYLGRCVALTFLCLVAASRVWAADSIDDLTGPWQLLVDDYLIAGKTNVTRSYHALTKYSGNPVLLAQQPWEQLNYIYGTVLPNETRTGYRMWYQSYLTNTCAGTMNELYATSANGLSWVKPSLNQMSWCGFSNNNLCYQSAMTSVMQTPSDPDPAKRYKLMNYGGAGWNGAWSSNGIDFVSAPNNPIFTGGSDSGQTCWDPRTQRYLCYVKNNWVDANGLNRRAVSLATTTNFTNWPSSAPLILWPDAFDDRWSLNITQRTHFYGLSAFPYETMYIGFLWIHRATNLTSSPAGYEGYQIGPIYSELVSSRDGVNWTREEGDRPPILPLGTAGSWEGGMVFTPRSPVVEGGTIKVWYSGFKNHHDTAFKKQASGIGLATLRKDGFASLDAGTTAGTILTRPFRNAGGPLLVNYHTNSSGGSLLVEALDESNNVLPGYSQSDCVPLMGNSTTQAVTWTAHTELPAGSPFLRLRFILQKASIYSFMAGTNATLADVPPPTLNSARQGDQVVLSWLTNFPAYGLQSSAALPATNWAAVSPAPVVTGARYVVTNAVTNAIKFYRLTTQ